VEKVSGESNGTRNILDEDEISRDMRELLSFLSRRKKNEIKSSTCTRFHHISSDPFLHPYRHEKTHSNIVIDSIIINRTKKGINRSNKERLLSTTSDMDITTIIIWASFLIPLILINISSGVSYHHHHVSNTQTTYFHLNKKHYEIMDISDISSGNIAVI
jgi:hypothetical protein